jgi:hypothetical protein
MNYTPPTSGPPPTNPSLCMTSTLMSGGIRLDRFRLSRLTDALLFVTQFVLGHRRPGGAAEGSLLSLPVPVAARPADGAYPAALDLARSRARRSSPRGRRHALRCAPTAGKSRRMAGISRSFHCVLRTRTDARRPAPITPSASGSKARARSCRRTTGTRRASSPFAQPAPGVQRLRDRDPAGAPRTPRHAPR